MSEWIIDRETGEILEAEKIENFFWEEESAGIPWKLDVEDEFRRGEINPAVKKKTAETMEQVSQHSDDTLSSAEAEIGQSGSVLESRLPFCGEPDKPAEEETEAERSIQDKDSDSQKTRLCGESCYFDGEERLHIKINWRLPAYQKKVAEQNLCDVFLPMIFFREQGEEWAYYNCGEYFALPEYFRQWRGTPQNYVCEVLRVLSEVCRCLLQMEDHLFRIDEIALSADRIFIHKKNFFVKLAFCPCFDSNGEKRCRKAPFEQLAAVVKEIDLVSAKSLWPVYSGGLNRELREQRLSVRDAMRLFCTRERELANPARSAAEEPEMTAGFNETKEPEEQGAHAEPIADRFKQIQEKIFSKTLG